MPTIFLKHALKISLT